MGRLSWLVRTFALMVMVFLPQMAAANESAPLVVDGAATINAAEAKAMFDQGALFIDPRNDADWEAGRVPGSVHLLMRDLSEVRLAEVAGKDEPVIFYCNGVKCDVSSKACAKAVSWGFTNVQYFREGFPGWMAAGYPVE